MSIEFFDGFETVGTETGLANQGTIKPRIDLRYDATSSGGTPATTGFYLIDSPTGSGYAWRQGKNKANWLRKWVTDEQDKTYVVGCNVHIPSTTDNTINIMAPQGNTTGSPDTHFSIWVNNRTDLRVSGTGTAINETVTDAFTPGAWHHVEAKFKVDTTTGSCIVKINGTEVVNETNVDTQDFWSNVVAMLFGGVGLGDTALTDTGEDYFAMDDIYILKTEGSAPTDFLGTRAAVLPLPPNGDSNVNWTPSSGTTHYTLVDENGADAADYVEETTDADVEMFNMTDLPNDGDIHAVKVEVEAVDTATGVNNMDVRVDSGGTVQETNFSVTDTVNYAVFVHYEGETNPDTSTDWTETTLNALLIGAQYNT